MPGNLGIDVICHGHDLLRRAQKLVVSGILFSKVHSRDYYIRYKLLSLHRVRIHIQRQDIKPFTRARAWPPARTRRAEISKDFQREK